MSYENRPMKNSYAEERKFYEVNPDKYIDMAIQNCLNAIPKALEANRPMADGLFAFRMSVDSLESLCIAKKTIKPSTPELPSGYFEVLEEKIKELPSDLEKNMKEARIADIKFRLLLSKTFDAKRISKTFVI